MILVNVRFPDDPDVRAIHTGTVLRSWSSVSRRRTPECGRELYGQPQLTPGHRFVIDEVNAV